MICLPPGGSTVRLDCPVIGTRYCKHAGAALGVLAVRVSQPFIELSRWLHFLAFRTHLLRNQWLGFSFSSCPPRLHEFGVLPATFALQRIFLYPFGFLFSLRRNAHLAIRVQPGTKFALIRHVLVRAEISGRFNLTTHATWLLNWDAGLSNVVHIPSVGQCAAFVNRPSGSSVCLQYWQKSGPTSPRN